MSHGNILDKWVASSRPREGLLSSSVEVSIRQDQIVVEALYETRGRAEADFRKFLAELFLCVEGAWTYEDFSLKPKGSGRCFATARYERTKPEEI